MKEAWKENRMACAGIVILIVIAASSMVYLGVASGQVDSDDSAPFIIDRVVEVYIVMSDEDWETCRLDALKEQYVQADFWFDGELVLDVAIRPKGNSSLNSVYRSGSSRLSFKIDFNFFNSARTFRGLKKINLNNGFNDPTLIRENLAYEVFDQMDVPTPRTAFVDLWINDNHMGLYTQVEQVDVTFLSRHFSDAGGNLYKPESRSSGLNWTEAELDEQRAEMGITETGDGELMQEVNMGGAKLVDIMQSLEEEDLETGANAENVRANPFSRQPMDYLEQAGLKTNEAFPDHSALLHFLDVFNNWPDESFLEEVENILDVDGALKFIAVAGTVGYFDSYLGMGHNYYLYEVDGKFTIIPWDLNGAFGAFTGGMSREDMINLYIDEPTSGPIAERPIVDRLLSYEPYLERYHQYLEELLEEPFNVDRMISRIDEVVDMIRPYVEADELKFYSTEEFERALTEDIPRSGQGDASGGGKMQPGGGQPLPSGISEESLICLRNVFDKDTLKELRMRRPSLQELNELESCLTREQIPMFLRQGPAMVEPRPMGSVYIGLKNFVLERTESVRKQLDGALPSVGDGSGNGGNMKMGGMKEDMLLEFPAEGDIKFGPNNKKPAGFHPIK